MSKICSRCGILKSVDEFYRNSSVKDRLFYYCKDCVRIEHGNSKRKKIKHLPEKKKCSNCKKIKLQSEFYFDSSKKDGLHSQCKECGRKRNKDYELQYKFGITEAQYDLMLEKQDNKCAICGRVPEENGKALAVDHNHKTYKVRGLLCSKCNHGLGLFDDDINTLKAAVKYRANDHD